MLPVITQKKKKNSFKRTGITTVRNNEKNYQRMNFKSEKRGPGTEIKIL